MGYEELTFSRAGVTTTLRADANKALAAAMERNGESFGNIHRAAVGCGNDPDAIQAAVWTGQRVYAFTAKGGCISLPLHPGGPLVEVTVAR